MSDQNREAVKQWLAKAASDWSAIEILTASDNCPTEAVCFHCQQYVEKLLKAFLTHKNIEAPKTHDIRRLVQLAAPFESKLAILAEESDSLTVHGVQSRYPGDFFQVEKKEMKKLVELTQKFSNILIPRL